MSDLIASVFNAPSTIALAAGYYPDQRMLVGARGTLQIRGVIHMILMRLLATSTIAVSYDNLISAVWPNPDREPEGAENNLRVHICKLRRLIADIEAPFCIRSVWGMGYILVGTI